MHRWHLAPAQDAGSPYIRSRASSPSRILRARDARDRPLPMLQGREVGRGKGLLCCAAACVPHELLEKAYDARISTGPPILSSLPAPLGTARGSRRRAFRAGAEAEFMDGRPRQGGPGHEVVSPCAIVLICGRKVSGMSDCASVTAMPAGAFSMTLGATSDPANSLAGRVVDRGRATKKRS